MTEKVVFCWPTVNAPHPRFCESMEATEPLMKDAGYEVGFTFEKGNPYISGARATMLKKAITAKADYIVFIDHDISWEPEDMLRLIKTPGDVVSGTYRTREVEPNYMGRPLQDDAGKLTSMREDGCIEMACVPAGFLKITRKCVEEFMRGYPALCYGPPWDQAVDLFNHGAWKGLWWGEDYAFCRRWRDIGGKVWCVPNMTLGHHEMNPGGREYRGNYHEYWLRQPGGQKEGVPYDDPELGQ